MSQRSVLYRNGAVYSPVDPFATAMLAVGDRVAWVGAEGAAESHADGVDEVVDLQERLVTPAFVDAHVHLTQTGLAMTSLDLAGTQSVDEVLDALAAYAAKHDGVILGFGWDDTDWPKHRAPTQDEVERAAPRRLVYLSRVDGHSGVPSAALVDAAPGIRAAEGFEPTGLVRRAAHHAVRDAVAELVTPDQRRDAALLALRHAASLGVGSVHEIAAPHINPLTDVPLLRSLTAAQPLPDVVAYWGQHVSDGGVAAVRAYELSGAAGDLNIDGSLGSRTAWLSTPYADAETCGSNYLDLAAATEHVVACTKAGVQAGFHVIGDAAVSTAIEAIGRAAEQCGLDAVLAARHRLEHVEMIDSDLVSELVRLGVVASVQPAFDAAWGGDDGMYAARLGVERARSLNPYALMARAGVQLAFGSDSPVTPISPWEGVRAAALHQTPGQRMTVRGAFSAHTRGGWRAAGRDDAGVLAPGQLASFAVWDVAEADLVVQTPDQRVAAWSTDPRSGVRGLPDLSPGLTPPTCLRTVAAGREIFAAGGVSR